METVELRKRTLGVLKRDSAARQSDDCGIRLKNRLRKRWLMSQAIAWFMLLRLAGLVHAQAAEALAAVTNLADLSLEQLLEVKVDQVYGASRYQQKVSQAPASVSLITAEEIKKFGYRDLADLLRGVRGLYVSNDRNYSYLGIRGFLRPGDYNTRVLVLIDGHRMNDNVFDGAFISREGMVDIDLVERVEVIRGPSSSIYGSSAFFGVINVITKSAAQLEGPEASVEWGSLETYKGRFSYGKVFSEEVAWLLSGSYYSSEGRSSLYYPEFDQRISPDPRAANNGVAEALDDERAVNLFSKLNYHEFTLSGYFNTREKKVPTASFSTVFNDGREETTDYGAYLDLEWDHHLSESADIKGRAFYDYVPYYGTYPLNYAAPGDPPNVVLNRDEVDAQWAGTEWQLSLRVLDRHVLSTGFEYRENLSQKQVNYDDLQPRFYHVDDDRSSRNIGIFNQAEVGLLTNLLFNAGFRYDYYSDSFGGTFNPRLGLIYSPWQGSAFKALYGEAFRAPNAYERFYSLGQTALPDLNPETIRTYELVYEQNFGHHYRSSLSGYYYTVEDLITQVTALDGSLGFANVENVRATGLEMELEARYHSGLFLRGSYVLQRAEDAETGARLTSSPLHVAKLNVSCPVYRDKLFAGLELQYNATMLSLAGRQSGDFLLANFTLFSRELLPGLELSGSVYNLFDTQYSLPGAEDHLQDLLRQEGRTFRLKLTYRF
ncbi:MAG TPA: TonB-dependent receptor [Clostridia bacterium]|nr:TonB-dependent receptor [Clostridia bacterium]